MRTYRPRIRVLLVALLGGFLAFDEYFPLFGRETGAANGVIPLLIAGTVAAQAIGGALAGPAYKLPVATFTTGLAAAAVLIATGALGRSAWGFLPIAIGYGVLQLVIVVSEARLQDVRPFCLTIDRQAPEYAPRVFGAHGYALLRNLERLPEVLVAVLRQLLRGP